MQVPSAEPHNWSNFLATLQASQQPVVHDWAISEPADHDWAGTVYWNGVWDKALETEAKVRQEKQQAAERHEAPGPAEPAAPPATGMDA